jgi:hypothetical protein
MLGYRDEINFIAIDASLSEKHPQSVIIVSHVDSKDIQKFVSQLLENYLRVMFEKYLFSFFRMLSKGIDIEVVRFILARGGFYVIAFFYFLTFYSLDEQSVFLEVEIIL